MCRDLSKCNEINLNKDRDGSDEKRYLYKCSEGRLQTFVYIFKIRDPCPMQHNIRNEVHKQITKGNQLSFEKIKKKKITHSFSITR